MKKELKKLFANSDLDSKSTESLISAMGAESLQGFDYLKFKTSCHALLEMGQSETMAFKSAIATDLSLIHI